jgi:hypothetical protein
LNASVNETLTDAEQLTEQLNSLYDKGVREALGVIRLEQRRRNCATLLGTLTLVSAVCNGESHARTLLHSADYAGALDVVEKCTAVLRSELSGVTALLAMTERLTVLQTTIEHSMEDAFVHAVMDEFVTNTVTHSAQSTRPIVSFAMTDEYLNALEPLTVGLCRRKLISRAMTRLCAALCARVRTTVLTPFIKVAKRVDKRRGSTVVSEDEYRDDVGSVTTTTTTTSRALSSRIGSLSNRAAHWALAVGVRDSVALLTQLHALSVFVSSIDKQWNTNNVELRQANDDFLAAIVQVSVTA